MRKEAERPEMLIPITIDFDVQSTHPDQQGLKIRDRFLWNLNEPFITPYQFSIIFCEDIGIPISPYAQRIQDLIEKQIEENQNAAEIDVTNEDVTENDVVWSDEEVEGVMDDTFENGDGDKDGDEESKEKQMEEEQGQEEAQVQEQGREQKEDKERSRKRKREGKDEKERNWAEPDCRVIVNVSFSLISPLSFPPPSEKLKRTVPSARRPNLLLPSARPYRMGPLLSAPTIPFRQTLLYRTRPHWRSHPSHHMRNHRRNPET